MFTNKKPETAQRAAQKSEGSGYMAELEKWLETVVFEPIERAVASGDAKELHLAFNEGKQLIKRRVLASYHNGLKAKSTNREKL